MYGILLWDSDLYGEDSYITRNGMHGIACITGQEIVLLHHCELNTSPIIESLSNAATNDRQQLHQPITCMLFQNDATDATGETKDDRGGGDITVNGIEIHEEEEQKKMMMMQLNNVFTLGCTVRSGSSKPTVELQGFPWWKTDARFRVNHKRNNNDIVVPPLHNSTNQNSSNCSNSDSIGSNEERYRNGYAQTSSAVDTASGSNSSRPILLQLPQSSITSNSMVTIGDESIAIINGAYTNGASLLNGQSSHKLDTIRVDVDSIAAAPMRRSKKSRKTCEDEDDNGLVKTSKGIVAQKKSKKRMRLQ